MEITPQCTLCNPVGKEGPASELQKHEWVEAKFLFYHVFDSLMSAAPEGDAQFWIDVVTMLELARNKRADSRSASRGDLWP